MKIAILGYSGAGKSTLARTLGQQLGCPVQHLDTVQFVPGWKERGRAEAAEIARRFLQSNDSWVIDGNYEGFAQAQRLAQADLIVILDFPRRICLVRALRRWLRFHGRTRPDLAPGCPDRIDAEFIWWILAAGRTPAHRQHLRDIALRWPDKTVVLRRPAQVRGFVGQRRYISSF